jgi:hypothetical protein
MSPMVLLPVALISNIKSKLVLFESCFHTHEDTLNSNNDIGSERGGGGMMDTHVGV